MKTVKFVLDVSAYTARWILLLLKRGLVVLLLVWLVLSHTVGWAADLTAAILRTGFSVVTVSAMAGSDARAARARNVTLSADLVNERRAAAGLATDLTSERAAAARFATDLTNERRVAATLTTDLTNERAITERLTADIFNERTATARLTDELDVAKLRISTLDENLFRARASSRYFFDARTTALETIDALRNPPVRTVMLNGQRVTVDEAVNTRIASARTRTTKVAQANLASIFGESIPVYGVAFIVGATAYELNSMKDLYEIQIALEPDTTIPTDRDEVCGLQVPTRAEVWSTVRESPSAAWSLTATALEESRGSLSRYAIPDMPDFSGRFYIVLDWFGSWYD